MAPAGDAVRVEVIKTDAYDLIGKVVGILPRPAKRPLATSPSPTQQVHETLHRITTGAPLRVLR